jgi:hypothetical protein
MSDEQGRNVAMLYDQCSLSKVLEVSDELLGDLVFDLV